MLPSTAVIYDSNTLRDNNLNAARRLPPATKHN